MYGRHDTVKYCYDELKDLDVDLYYITSNSKDRLFLENLGVPLSNIFRYANSPLTKKMNYGLRKLSKIDFDGLLALDRDWETSKTFNSS